MWKPKITMKVCIIIDDFILSAGIMEKYPNISSCRCSYYFNYAAIKKNNKIFIFMCQEPLIINANPPKSLKTFLLSNNAFRAYNSLEVNTFTNAHENSRFINTNDSAYRHYNYVKYATIFLKKY